MKKNQDHFFYADRPRCETGPIFSKFNLRPILGPWTEKMISYTKNIFASISAAFWNRDGKDWPQWRVLGCFGIIKIIFYLIFVKSGGFGKISTNTKIYKKSFGN